MTPFEKLLVARLVGDWILGQTHWEACNKGKRWSAAFSHAGKWTFVMLLGLALVYNTAPNAVPFATWSAVVAMGILHAIIDRRGFTQWLIKVKEWAPWGYPHMEPGKAWEMPLWVVICIDQVLHILQVAVIASLI